MVLIATDFLSSRKLPNAPRILPIVPGKDKQIRQKIGTTACPERSRMGINTNEHFFHEDRKLKPQINTDKSNSMSSVPSVFNRDVPYFPNQSGTTTSSLGS
jgi:hypothetical protein